MLKRRFARRMAVATGMLALATGIAAGGIAVDPSKDLVLSWNLLPWAGGYFTLAALICFLARKEKDLNRW